MAIELEVLCKKVQYHRWNCSEGIWQAQQPQDSECPYLDPGHSEQETVMPTSHRLGRPGRIDMRFASLTLLQRTGCSCSSSADTRWHHCILTDGRPLPVHLHFSFFSRDVTVQNNSEWWAFIRTAVETELREGVVRTDNCNNNNVFNKCMTFGFHGRHLSARCLLFVTSRWLQLVYQVSEKIIPTPHPPSFKNCKCEDKVKFCKYAADRQIHCGVSTGHVWANIHRNLTVCCYQLCDRLSTASSSSYIICVTAGPVTSVTCHYMRRIHESWVTKDLEGIFRVLVDIDFWPLP